MEGNIMDKELKFTIILFFLRLFLHPWGQMISESESTRIVESSSRDIEFNSEDLMMLNKKMFIYCEPDILKRHLNKATSTERELMNFTTMGEIVPVISDESIQKKMERWAEQRMFEQIAQLSTGSAKDKAAVFGSQFQFEPIGIEIL